VLPVKKLEEAELDRIAKDMSKAIPKGKAVPPETKKPEPEPAETGEQAKEEEPEGESEDEEVDIEKISFDF